MSHRHHLQAGDRVNWPGDARDRGTVIEEEGKLIVVWDRRVDDSREHDLSEVAHDGRITDLSHRVVVELRERAPDLAGRRKLAADAERRLVAGRRAQAAIERQREQAAAERDRRNREEEWLRVRPAGRRA